MVVGGGVPALIDKHFRPYGNMNLSTAVLDALADDFENVKQIKKYLLFLGYEIQLNKIEEIIQELLAQELIYINQDLSDNAYTWYGMTEKGRALWLQENF